jgi:hypothetical protein
MSSYLLELKAISDVMVETWYMTNIDVMATYQLSKLIWAFFIRHIPIYINQTAVKTLLNLGIFRFKKFVRIKDTIVNDNIKMNLIFSYSFSE